MWTAPRIGIVGVSAGSHLMWLMSALSGSALLPLGTNGMSMASQAHHAVVLHERTNNALPAGV
jgi:hypothetical protein